MMAPDVEPFLEHFHEREGFCHPDWERIWELAEATLPETEWGELWDVLPRRWVDRLRQALGGGYRVIESENFLILSGAPDRIVAEAGRFYEKARVGILEAFPGVARDEGFGKHVVLMFEELDDYYAYICYFYPEGDHPMSGGVFLGGEGYAHFALPTFDSRSYLAVMAHELTHGLLAHLPIPLWLNEALAMRMESALCGEAGAWVDEEECRRHEEQWNSETVLQFWSGESWGDPGPISGLSYTLAQILWRNLDVDLRVGKDEMLAFINQCKT